MEIGGKGYGLDTFGCLGAETVFQSRGVFVLVQLVGAMAVELVVPFFFFFGCIVGVWRAFLGGEREVVR